MSQQTTASFKIKEGENVWSPIYGNGTINFIDYDDHTIQVRFDYGQSWWYNFDGSFYVNDTRTFDLDRVCSLFPVGSRVVTPNEESTDQELIMFIRKLVNAATSYIDANLADTDSIVQTELKEGVLVLVRDDENTIWKLDIFKKHHEHNAVYPYETVINYYKYCIPYKGNEDKYKCKTV